MVSIADTPQNRAVAKVAELLLGNWPHAETIVKAVLEEIQPNWRSIESAPREVTVLVTNTASGRDPCWCWYAMLEEPAWGKLPTHWMPLPALPPK